MWGHTSIYSLPSNIPPISPERAIKSDSTGASPAANAISFIAAEASRGLSLFIIANPQGCIGQIFAHIFRHCQSIDDVFKSSILPLRLHVLRLSFKILRCSSCACMQRCYITPGHIYNDTLRTSSSAHEPVLFPVRLTPARFLRQKIQTLGATAPSAPRHKKCAARGFHGCGRRVCVFLNRTPSPPAYGKYPSAQRRLRRDTRDATGRRRPSGTPAR